MPENTGQLQQRQQQQPKLHQLNAMDFYLIYTNLAQPPDDPLIRRVMPFFFQQSQQDIFALEAGANGNSVTLAHDALQWMGQRLGVTLAHLLQILGLFPETRLLFDMLNRSDHPGQAQIAVQIPLQPAAAQGSVFLSCQPSSRGLIVDEGATANFQVTLHPVYRNGAVLSWHKDLESVVLCYGEQLVLKSVTQQEQGQYRCCVRLAQMRPNSASPSLLFSLRVRPAAFLPPPQLPQQPPPPQQQRQQQEPPPYPLERTHKYALVISCQSYTDERIVSLGRPESRDLTELQGHLEKLGYRCCLLLNARRAEILSAIETLHSILVNCLQGTAPHLFLLLDGHGAVIHTDGPGGRDSTSFFLPSDAVEGEPSTYLRQEEDILQPLSRCLPNSRGGGLLVGVFDMCRCVTSYTVRGGADGGVGGGCGSGGPLGRSVQDMRIHRLHATSYSEAAAIDVRNDGRETFGVAALNRRLAEDMRDSRYEQLLQPMVFLPAVSGLIRELSSRVHLMSPEVQASHSKTHLAELVVLSDRHLIQCSQRLVPALQPAHRKFALLLGAGAAYAASGAAVSGGLAGLPFVRGELLRVQAGLQLLGYQTVLWCDQPQPRGGRAALLALVREFCDLLRAAGQDSQWPVQAVLVVDGHGRLELGGAEEQGAGDGGASSVFLLPSADASGRGEPECVDIEREVAQELLAALRETSAEPRLLFGFYDTCRVAEAGASAAAATAATPVRYLESPEYCRFFTASARRTAYALHSGGSYGISALLECLREADFDKDALQPQRLVTRVAELIVGSTHASRPGATQYPSYAPSSVRTSLAELDAYLIQDRLVRAEIVSRVRGLRERHGLLG